MKSLSVLISLVFSEIRHEGLQLRKTVVFTLKPKEFSRLVFVNELSFESDPTVRHLLASIVHNLFFKCPFSLLGQIGFNSFASISLDLFNLLFIVHSPAAHLMNFLLISSFDLLFVIFARSTAFYSLHLGATVLVLCFVDFEASEVGDLRFLDFDRNGMKRALVEEGAFEEE